MVGHHPENSTLKNVHKTPSGVQAGHRLLRVGLIRLVTPAESLIPQSAQQVGQKNPTALAVGVCQSILKTMLRNYIS